MKCFGLVRAWILMRLSLYISENLRRRRSIRKTKIPTHSFYLRRMQEKDLPFVLEIERMSFPNPWQESAFRGEIGNLQISYPHVIVLRPHEKIIGYVIFWHIIDEAQISNIAIHPDFRRMRIAERVLKEILEMIRKYEAKHVVLEVRPSNVAARSLYNKYGFQILGVRKDYYLDPVEDALVMVKHLQ